MDDWLIFDAGNTQRKVALLSRRLVCRTLLVDTFRQATRLWNKHLHESIIHLLLVLTGCESMKRKLTCPWLKRRGT